jgi:DNA-binding helix-hairpin-helix protein with protein kinase domain
LPPSCYPAPCPAHRGDAVLKAQDELRRVCDLRWQDLQAVITQVDGDDVTARHKKEGKTLIRQIQSLQGQLVNAPREAQLKAFLEKFPLQNDSVSGIGQSRITQLASFGIESAGDIDRDAIMQVPGFGPQLADGSARGAMTSRSGSGSTQRAPCALPTCGGSSAT